MAVESINIGNVANDGTGDDLRVAFQKVNRNFTDLDNRFVPQNTAENLGSGTGVFYLKDEDTLKFRTLVGGDNITLSATGETITISSPGQLKIDTDGSRLTLSGPDRIFGITGGNRITTELSGNDIVVNLNNSDLLSFDNNPTLSADLNAGSNNITNASTITATNFVGDLTGNVHDIDIRTINSRLFEVDLGSFINETLSAIGLLLAFSPLDYGSITSPSQVNSDFGSIV